MKKGDILVKFEEEPFLSKHEIALAEYEAAKAKIKEIESLLKVEELKIEEKVLLKNLSVTKINRAKAKRESELSSLKYYKSEKIGLKSCLKIKLLQNQNLKKPWQITINLILK